MNLKEYQQQAKRTCPDLFPDKDLGTASFLNTSHMIYGMISEIPELIEALGKEDYVNVGEELADIVWYVANYCTFHGIDLQDTLIVDGNKEVPCRTYIDAITYFIGELADIEKKELAYKKSYSYEKQIDILQNLMYYITRCCRVMNVDFHKSLHNNIEKLKVRFPDKFTEQNALNRNLELERKELEK